MKTGTVYKPAIIMRRHWKELLPASPFLQHDLTSGLKNETFFIFSQQKEDILPQTNFTSFLHFPCNVFPCTNFRKCRGLDIWHRCIFSNERDFASIYTKKSGAIF